MNIIDILMFVVTSVLPITVLVLAFSLTLWFLWLFWSLNIHDVNEAPRLQCASLFYKVLFADIGYFFLAGLSLCLLKSSVLNIVYGTGLALIGLCAMCLLFHRLERKTVVS